MHTSFVCLTAVSCACAAALAGPAGAIHSTFDTDAQGWSTDKDARNFRWESTDGNPGGFIAADDIGSGQYWRFAAPAEYLGDLSAYYGQTLSYELKQLGAVGTVSNQSDIDIVGAGITLEYRFGVTPSGEWTPFSVEISEGAGWEVAGMPASEAQIQAVLADVTSLSIRGEFRVGADSCGLDNVQLGDGCPADLNNDGELNFFDVSAFIDAYNTQDPAADFAEPFGEFNFFDVSAFIAAFNAGC
ncbi:MAG: hypothetical protein KDA29_03350 [Phycisphaerales bacterium]|nr:hypothetical protein [Phycisphaerales bacterium]